MERLKFYNVDDKYIQYLYNFDKKVPYNKNSKRPYIGIIFEINEMTYFAPMFSPKQQHKKYRNLLIQQNSFIQLNTEKIRNMVNKLYRFVTCDKKEFFLQICCDFKLLEEKCKEFKNEI